MPNADLSNRTCDHCGVVGALLQCGKCKQVAYCNFQCQRVAWKAHKPHCGVPVQCQPAEEKATAPVANWEASCASQLPRPKLKLGMESKPAKIEDFFDREDLDCGLAPLREKTAKTSASREDGLNYSKWDNLADDEEKKSRRYVPTPATTRTAAPGAKPALFGQAMGAEPARQANKVADTRTPAEKRAAAREALDEAENLLHQVAGEVLYQAGFMGHGSVWELGPAAEKVARKCLRLLDSKLGRIETKLERRVLPVLPKDALAKFLHGSSNFFLRRAISSKDAEKQSNAKEAKASLLEVYRDKELIEEYRENACDFLAALLHEEGKPEEAELVQAELLTMAGG